MAKWCRHLRLFADFNDKLMISVTYKSRRKSGGEHFVLRKYIHSPLKYVEHCRDIFRKAYVKNAVVTVPAYFSNPQRKASTDANAIISLNVDLRLKS